MIPCSIDLSSRSFFRFLEAIGAFDVLKVPFVFDQLADLVPSASLTWSIEKVFGSKSSSMLGGSLETTEIC